MGPFPFDLIFPHTPLPCLPVPFLVTFRTFLDFPFLSSLCCSCCLCNSLCCSLAFVSCSSSFAVALAVYLVFVSLKGPFRAVSCRCFLSHSSLSRRSPLAGSAPEKDCLRGKLASNKLHSTFGRRPTAWILMCRQRLCLFSMAGVKAPRFSLRFHGVIVVFAEIVWYIVGMTLLCTSTHTHTHSLF